MIRSIVTATALVAVLAVPMTAAAHATITPKALAWQRKDLSNKNLKFGGSPYRVTSVNCLAHGGGMFVCRASLNDGHGRPVVARAVVEAGAADEHAAAVREAIDAGHAVGAAAELEALVGGSLTCHASAFGVIVA